MSASNGHADDAEAPVTPRAPRSSGRAMRVLATPIISVAVTPRSNRSAQAAPVSSLSNPPYEVVKPTKSAPNASAWPLELVEEARQEPPAGVVEGVTLVEPRAVPGNGADLDSIILGPGVQSEAVAHREGERRRAPTIRTRMPFRKELLAPTSAPRGPSRRSSTLLAAVIAIALVLVGVSALLHTESDPPRVNEVAEGAAPRQRLDVQAAIPQAPPVAIAPPAPAVEPVTASQAQAIPLDAHREATAPAEHPMQAAAEHPAQSAPATPALETAPNARVRAAVAAPARPAAPTRSARSTTASPRSAPRGERNVDLAGQAVPAASESKSWIKVRD